MKEQATSTRRVSAYVGAVCLVGALLAAGVAAGAVHSAAPDQLAVLAAFAFTVISLRIELPVMIGARKNRVVWGEAALLLSFVLVPASWVIIVQVLAAGLVELSRHSPRQRAAFNTSAAAISATVAVLVVHGVDRASGHATSWELPVSSRPSSWLALSVATLAYPALTFALVAGAISLTTDARLVNVLRTSAGSVVVGAGSNLVVGLLILAGWRWSRPTLLLAPLLIAGLVLQHRRAARADTERDALRRLEVASRAFESLDEQTVGHEVVTRARSLFSVTDVELLLTRSSGATVVYACSTEQDRAVPRAATAKEQALATEPMGALLAVLQTDGHIAGSLRLRGLPEAVSRQERQVLDTFAHSVCAALRNVRTYEAKVFEAQHDVLTGLPNRALLETQAREAIEEVEGTEQGLALLLLDLDNFKSVNDTLGHAAGDRLLIEVAQRLAGTVRPGDVVARLGGDEFAVLMRTAAAPLEASTLADSLLFRLKQPIDIEGLRVSVEGSIGAAVFPADADTVDDLLRCADVAMYRAKSRGHAVARYEAAGDANRASHLAILAELQHALDNDQLELYYQPQVCLQTGAVTGAEALARWRHPERGLVPPDDFIPAVERSSLIGAFTLSVLDRAVADCAAWQETGLRGRNVSVNLSVRNLLQHTLPDEVRGTLERHGLPADLLVLEITETAMLTEAEVCEEVLGRLRELGVRLSVDDFGTGYSSLTFLQRVALDEVKLDRAFVSKVTGSESAATIVGAVTALAHGLGLVVVAEGIETEAQLEHLQRIGCDSAQGYHLGRPKPLAEFLADATAPRVPLPRREGPSLRVV